MLSSKGKKLDSEKKSRMQSVAWTVILSFFPLFVSCLSCDLPWREILGMMTTLKMHHNSKTQNYILSDRKRWRRQTMIISHASLAVPSFFLSISLCIPLFHDSKAKVITVKSNCIWNLDLFPLLLLSLLFFYFLSAWLLLLSFSLPSFLVPISSIFFSSFFLFSYLLVVDSFSYSCLLFCWS